jgi:trimeric autotransporter adhesin
MKRVITLAVLLLLVQFAHADTTPYYIVQTIAGRGRLPFVGEGQSAANVYLFSPERMALDANGNLYFTERYYNQVFKVSAGGAITLFAGDGEIGSSGDGGPARQGRFTQLEGIAVGPDGSVYIGDSALIRRVSPAGIITTFAGTGNDGYSGDGGAAAQAALSQATGMCFDRSGNLYFADDLNHVVRRISTAGIITTVAGTGALGSTGDNQPARNARLNSPYAVAMDTDGTLYIADTGNNRIRRVGTDGIIKAFAGTGEAGDSGDGSAATLARFLNPYGVAVDSGGNVLICDGSNGRLRRVSRNGVVNTVSADFSMPYDVSVTPANAYLVNDWGGRRIFRLENTGTTGFVGANRTTGIGDRGPATSAVLLQPEGVVVDRTGAVLIADAGDGRVRRVDNGGVIDTFAGKGFGAGYSGDNGPAVSAGILQPDGLAIDAQGNTYVTSNVGVRRIDSAGRISTYAGNLEIGYSGDDGPAVQARVNFPGALATDANYLYIADTYNHRIRRVNASGIITTIAGNGVQGYSGSGAAGKSTGLNTPMGVAADGAGNLYIADTYNQRVRKLSASGILTDFAGNGIAGSLGDGGAATSAQLWYPYGVAVDPAGNVIIASGGQLRRVAPDGIITTIAGSGFSAYDGDGDLALNAGMLPWGVATDSAGRIYFSDAAGYRVRRLDPVQIFQSGVVNGASFLGGGVAPGEIITIFGWQIGPAQIAFGAYNAGELSKNAAGVRVTFDGVAAPLIYALSGQISAIVPYSVYGKSQTTMQVTYNGKDTNTIRLAVTDAMPALFTANASGGGQGAILNQDGSVNSAANPSAPGGVIVLYATGEGQTAPGGVDGQQALTVYPKPLLPVKVFVGGVECSVKYAGAAPYFVAGAMQVNAQLPANVAKGDAVEVRLQVGERISKTGVTVAIR